MSSYIPLELITRILSKLDIKTLVRCSAVSKQWHSLIDSSDFIKTQMNHSIKTNTNNTLFILCADGHLYSLDFDTLCPGNNLVFLQDQSRFKIRKPIDFIVGSCNGLLSLADEDGGLLICNPWLQKYKQKPSFYPDTINFMGMFAPNGDFVFEWRYGFGYDVGSNDYNVVRVMHFRKLDGDWRESEMTIYSSMKGLSRVLKMPYVVRSKHAMGVYIGGALHWIVSRFDNYNGLRIIVGFDLGVDVFKEVLQPDYGGNVTSLDIGVLGGCLCVFAEFRDIGVDVWVMKEYGVKDSWSKTFSISSSILCYVHVRPLGYSKEGGAVLLELDSQRLVWYEIEKKRAVDFVIEGQEHWYEAILCLNSLVVPKHEQPPTRKRKIGNKRDDFLSTGFKLKL